MKVVDELVDDVIGIATEEIQNELLGILNIRYSNILKGGGLLGDEKTFKRGYLSGMADTLVQCQKDILALPHSVDFDSNLIIEKED